VSVDSVWSSQVVNGVAANLTPGAVARDLYWASQIAPRPRRNLIVAEHDRPLMLTVSPIARYTPGSRQRRCRSAVHWCGRRSGFYDFNSLSPP
jgi:hypothetical protein